MKKHSLSHALSVMVSTISSALLVDLIKKYIPFVNEWLCGFSGNVVDHFDLNYSPQGLSLILIATFLAALWGIGFAYLNR